MVVKNFLNPKSIAIIGASDHEDKVGGILMRKLSNFSGKIIPINPSHDVLFGKKCYKNILEYNDSVELAVIAVKSDFVFDVLEQCGKKKIKDIIIISAGFSEIGKKNEEKRLLDVACKYDMRILGPNCFGICNPYKNLDLTFAKNIPKKGNVAFISQSGALWSYISNLNYGFSGFVSLGNMADLEFSEFIDYFSKDKKTKSIVLYVEKLKNGKNFIEICKKCQKKIYVVKAGSSAAGSKAAVSHTGSLATDYEIYKGAFKQAGVELCESLEYAIQKAFGKKIKNRNISKKKITLGKNIFILTNAGGAAALAADYLSDLRVKDIEIKDILGTALALDYKKALNETKEKNYDSIIVILTAQSMSEIEKTAEEIIDFKNKTRKNVIALFLGVVNMTTASKFLEENRIICFNSLENFNLSLKS